MMSPVEEIRVSYATGDFGALYRACRSCRKNAILVLILVPIVFGFLSYTDGYRGIALLFEVLPYSLIGLAVVVGIYFFGPWQAVRARSKSGWSEPLVVTLSDEGIRTRHPNQETLFYWSKIRDVVVRGPRVFLFTTPACAIILPRRCFESDAQFADWARRAETFWRSAKSVTVE